jgi:NADP-dependent aldehyde dehydrogenase
MSIHGFSLINGKPTDSGGTVFAGFDPQTGASLDPRFHSASSEDVDLAASLAEEAFLSYGKLSGREKGRFLRQIATEIELISEQLVERARLETALPEKRLQGEVGRTTAQLRLFAQVVEEGSWVTARIDPAEPERTPMPRVDLRSMLRPLGPVAVFGASNFPLAFSVAGGDTASALAAGNPVIVKAHPAHPGTSELVGQAICRSLRSCDLPQGVFSLLFDAGTEVGVTLVQHPKVKAVGFTGSLAAGKALMTLAATRPEPIPCFMEMSSTNPFFVLPQALQTRGSQIGKGLFASFTLGTGQFCTKPGLIFLPRNEDADTLVAELVAQINQATPSTMLNQSICRNYSTGIERRQAHDSVTLLAMAGASEDPNNSQGVPALLQIRGSDLLRDQELAKELFGPCAIVVRYESREEMIALALALEGQLTATVQGTDSDLEAFADLISILEGKAGRLIFNGYPTGVEVCHAMIHGGPYPATSDSRSTSVGSQAIFRFARPVCYQDFPQAALPAELKDQNPLGIWRLLDGEFTRAALKAPTS